jgi:hypothetical protein
MDEMEEKETNIDVKGYSTKTPLSFVSLVENCSKILRILHTIQAFAYDSYQHRKLI